MPKWWCSFVLAAACCGCATSSASAPRDALVASPAPPWAGDAGPPAGSLCGLGVAGAGFDERSPYPKALSAERAINNLAGSLCTDVQEALIDRDSTQGVGVELERALHIDTKLLAQVAAAAKIDFWLDIDGVGPYSEKGFTYAHACLPATTLQQFATNATVATAVASQTRLASVQIPPWLSHIGAQRSGQVCAVGYSLPAFFADDTFQGVVDDVRAQLALVVESLIGVYARDVVADGQTFAEQVTVASNFAVASGAIVTNFWFDRDGRGPNGQKRGTYGWGCIYPVEAVRATLASVAETSPAKSQVAQVQVIAESALAAWAQKGTPVLPQLNQPPTPTAPASRRVAEDSGSQGAP